MQSRDVQDHIQYRRYTFFKEAGHLVILVVLERENDSEWGDSYFAQYKPKTNRVFF